MMTVQQRPLSPCFSDRSPNISRPDSTAGLDSTPDLGKVRPIAGPGIRYMRVFYAARRISARGGFGGPN